MSNRQSPSPTGMWASLFNLQDAGNVVDWIESGKFTPELFEKYLSHTAKDISQGLRDYQLVSSFLVMIHIWTDTSDDAALLSALSSALTSLVFPETLPPNLQMHIGGIVASFLYYKDHRKDVQGSVIDVKSSLVGAIKSIRSSVLNNDQWIQGVIAPMGLSGSVRDVTPVYNLTETQFVDTVLEKMGDFDTEELWRQCEMMRRTKNVFLRLSGGYHSVFYTCWNCNQVFVKVFQCGRCKGARYCSRKCQAAAWMGGHKKKCKRLKMMHECFLVDLEEVERVHVTGMLDGLELSPQADRLVMELSFTAGLHTANRARIPSSMKNFYENLGRINRGEWWGFDLSDREKYANRTNNAAKDIRNPDVLWVLKLLTVDWFALARSTLGTASVDPQQVSALSDPEFRRECSPPISAETLLEIYRTVDPEMPYRPHFKVSGYHYLRLNYNELEGK